MYKVPKFSRTKLNVYNAIEAEMLESKIHRPWIIFDYKGDDLIQSIGATEIAITGPVPNRAGIYIVKPIPQIDDNKVLDFLWRCWAKEYVGIYIDEGYMIGKNNAALTALLTQGRSKQIEMIILTQRPVWANKFIYSKAI